MGKIVALQVQFEGDEKFHSISVEDLGEKCVLLTGKEMKFLDLVKPEKAADGKGGDPPEKKGEEIKVNADLKAIETPGKLEDKDKDKQPSIDEKLGKLNTALEELTGRIKKVEEIEGRTTQVETDGGKKSQEEGPKDNDFWSTKSSDGS